MNFGQLKTKVAAYLHRSDLVDQLGDWVNTAIKKLEMDENFPYMATTLTGAFAFGDEATTLEGVSSITGDVITGDAASQGGASSVAADLYLDIPANYKEMIGFFLLDASGQRVRLEHRDYVQAVLDNNDYTNDVAQIKTYTTLLETMRFLLRPAPDAQYTYDMRFWRFSDELVAEADTNWILTNFWQIAFYGALIEAEPFLYNDPRSATWLQFYEDAVRRLKKQARNEQLSEAVRKVYTKQLTA